MLNSAVLLLNSTYEPLNIINVKRALRLLFTDKANVIETDGSMVRSSRKNTKMPLVVRLSYYVKRPHQHVRFTKQAVFVRDQFTCQYCGIQSRDLTLDHVVPKTRNGETTWGNVVAACKSCNSAKSDKSLKDAGLKLKHQPKEPKFLPYLKAVNRERHQEWNKYLFTDTDSPFLLQGPLPV